MNREVNMSNKIMFEPLPLNIRTCTKTTLKDTEECKVYLQHHYNNNDLGLALTVLVGSFIIAYLLRCIMRKFL